MALDAFRKAFLEWVNSLPPDKVAPPDEWLKSIDYIRPVATAKGL